MLKKFGKAVENILKRSLVHDNDAPYFCFNKKVTLRDVILESILPSPYMLICDIINNLKSGMKSFSYNRNDLKRLSDKDWKYYSLVERLPDEKFSLTILKLTEKEYEECFEKKPQKGCSMIEIGDEVNPYKETVWINGDDISNDSYDEGFKNMLKHELGHVWTFMFETLEDSFKDGQASFNDKELDLNAFTQYQKDVYFHLYNFNMAALKADYDYILKKKDESANFELPVHIDNIIEILVADYLEDCHVSTNTYLYSLWRKLELNYEFSLNTLNLLKHYRENRLYEGYSSIESVKNPIRRLFLIFAFGTDEQIEYFKNACEEEFGKIYI